MPRAPCPRASPDRRRQNTNAPETAHSPGSAAALEHERVRRIEPDGAQQFHTRGPPCRRIEPGRRGKRGHERRAARCSGLPTRRTSRSPFSSMSRRSAALGREPREIVLRDRAESRTPARRRSAPSDDARSSPTSSAAPASSKPSSSSAVDSGSQPGLAVGHRNGADHAAEHQPLRRLVLRRRRARRAAPPPTRPPSTWIASGQSMVDRLFRRRAARSAHRPAPPCRHRRRGARCAAARPAPARRRTRPDRSGRRRRACRRRAPRRSPWHARRRRRPRASVTRRKAGGRSSAGANGVLMRVSGGMRLPGWRFRIGIIIT